MEMNIYLQNEISQKLTFCNEWEESFSDCVPGAYGTNYWEVFIDPEDIEINGNIFIFSNAYFSFEVQMYSSNDGLKMSFVKEASGSGKFIYSNNVCKVFCVEIKYDKDLMHIPLRFGVKYSLEELRSLYKNNTAIPETKDEEYKIYIENVFYPYESMKIKKYLNDDIKKLIVSNYGNIKYKDKIIEPSFVKERRTKNYPWKKYMDEWENYLEIIIPGIRNSYPLLLVHRLVAEVWCDNPAPNKYSIVHHIGNDQENNSQNLLFVSKIEHDLIHE